MSRAALTRLCRPMRPALFHMHETRPHFNFAGAATSATNAAQSLMRPTVCLKRNTMGSVRQLSTGRQSQAQVSNDVSVGPDDGFFIPIIDFGKFLNGTEAERQDTAAQILGGFQNAGFIYLQNHTISLDTIKTAFATSAKFFDQTDDAKLSLAWTSPEANRGYSARGREKVSQQQLLENVTKDRQTAPDMKESFEIGREGSPSHPNQWPQEGVLDSFKPNMLEFFGLCKQLHADVMSAIAVGMELDAKYFDKFIDVGDNTLRLLHYPSVGADVWRDNANAVRAGAHSDYGSLTLLFQDARGGLQVKSPSGKYVDAPPIEGAIVVNAGDLLARWSNDTIKSTIHRVVEPPKKETGSYPPRYSIAYFCNPNQASFIEALPGTYKTEQDKIYTGINSGDYLVQRLSATY